MNAIFGGIAGVFRKLMAVVRENVMETALCLTYFAIFILYSSIPLLVWFFPHITLCFTLNKLKSRSKFFGYLYYLSWFIWIPLLHWASNCDGWSLLTSYFLACLALVIGTEKMDNPTFGKNAIFVAIRFCEGLLVGVIIWATFSILMVSVVALFKLYLAEGWYSYPTVFNWLVFTPLLCCRLLKGPAVLHKGGGLLRILIDRILSIALIIYSIILYCYIISILIKWELPEGGVAFVVLGFLCMSLVCYLLRLQLENRHYEWFFKAFPSIALPTIILLWIGIIRRVGEYGLTDCRFYLLMLSVLVTIFIVMLVKKRSRRFQLMAIILAVSAITFTYIPGIRAIDFGIRSQKARLERLLPSVLENGVFPTVINNPELAKDSIKLKNLEQCYGAWDYLKDKMDAESFDKAYGQYGHFERNFWRTPEDF